MTPLEIKKASEVVDDGLTHEQRQLKARQERAARLREHHERDKAFQRELAGESAAEPEAAPAEAEDEAKAEKPAATEENKADSRPVANKSAKA